MGGIWEAKRKDSKSLFGIVGQGYGKQKEKKGNRFFGIVGLSLGGPYEGLLV